MAESNEYRQPPQGFIKLNFDGAVKHNSGEADIGGVFRDAGGNTLRTFGMDCGEASNNEAELHALKRGLEIVLRVNFKRLQIEGDSKLVIDMVRKLQQQQPVEIISKS